MANDISKSFEAMLPCCSASPNGNTNHPDQSSLNLSPEEKRVYGQLFQQADTESLGVITGDVAVKFFERTKLDASLLGEVRSNSWRSLDKIPFSTCVLIYKSDLALCGRRKPRPPHSSRI